MYAAKAMLSDPSYRLVLLDELNIVLRYDYLPLDEGVAVLKAWIDAMPPQMCP